jgi:hypothetical protein
VTPKQKQEMIAVLTMKTEEVGRASDLDLDSGVVPDVAEVAVRDAGNGNFQSVLGILMSANKAELHCFRSRRQQPGKFGKTLI